MAGHAELPHDEYVKRSIQRSSHFVPNGHPTPREREHDHIIAISVAAQTGCQLSARLVTIRIRMPIVTWYDA